MRSLSRSRIPSGVTAVPTADSHPPGTRPIWPHGVIAAVAYLLGGVLLQAAGASTVTLVAPLVDAPGWAWLPIFAVGCAGLLFRRGPVPMMLAVTGTAIVASLVLGGGVYTYLLSFELFFSGALYGRARISEAVVRTSVLVGAAMVIGALVLVADWRFWIYAGLQASVICVPPVWWASSVRRHQHVAEAEKDRAEAERTSARRAAELASMDLRLAVAAERAQMARDLHDVVAGHLSATALQSAAALTADDPDLHRRVLTGVRRESLSALEQMRSMIDVLESGDGTDAAAGGLEQLDDLADSARAAGNPVTLDVGVALDVENRPLPPLTDAGVYRIVAEALTNAIKHAPGADVDVRVEPVDHGHPGGRLRVRVSNRIPAVLGPAAPGTGRGLPNMRLRAEQLGGTLTAGHDDGGHRWNVEALLPLGRA